MPHPSQQVFDPVRRRYVALTPEETVRQQVIHYLHDTLSYPLELMQVEGSISLNGMTRRCDIVIFSPQLQPLLIVECKQPSVPINQRVLDQASRYNLVLHVPLLYLTNARQHLVLHVDPIAQRLTQLPSLPPWPSLLQQYASSSPH